MQHRTSLPQLLENMRLLAVISVATGVLRTELLQLRQERDETFRPSLLEYEVKPKCVPSLLFVNVGKALTIRTTPYGMSY